MKSFVHHEGKLTIKDMPSPTALENEVVISLKYAGLNRRDLYIEERRKDVAEALILGSDGAGIVESTGKNVTRFKEGDEVIINPSLRWQENSEAPPENFDILGMPDHGTFAEKIAIHEDQVELKPDHLTWEHAGVLSLAALTAYRALFTKGNFKRGQTVFIPGAGGGVATYLIIFAKHAGGRVITTSRDAEKREKAKKILGADIVLSTNSDWEEALKEETVDIVIDSIGKATFNRSLAILKRGGTFVMFGATTEDVVPLDLRHFFYGQFKLVGSTMGSREEFLDMLSFIKDEGIYPELDKVFPLDKANDAFAYLKDSDQFGKVGLKIK
ncbi:MAG TPA: zinc-binding dehydrogenase [Bacillota bacterium]|nr:zinc-binding dehydrogenase [Bacillota bacterium]